jgi:hypothetical protein
VTYSKSTCSQLHGLALWQMKKLASRCGPDLFVSCSLYEANELALFSSIGPAFLQVLGTRKRLLWVDQLACPKRQRRLARLRNTRESFVENFVDSDRHWAS